MRLFSKLIFMSVIFSVASYATENYGGIGVALYKSYRGVSVAGVAKKSPADIAGLNIGDCILEVDGTSLQGKSVTESKDLIRGTSGKPVSLKIARAEEILTVDVNRIDLSVVNVKDEKDADIVKCSNCTLLDVVETKKKKAGFYVKQENVPIFPEIKPVDALKNVKLLSFTRRNLSVNVKKTSAFRVSLFTMNGAFVKCLEVTNVRMGQMDIRWDNSILSAGQYTIEIEQGNKKNRSIKRIH